MFPQHALCVLQVPSSKDIKKKLEKPLAAVPSPQELASKAKANAPDANILKSKAKAQVSTFTFTCGCHCRIQAFYQQHRQR